MDAGHAFAAQVGPWAGLAFGAAAGWWLGRRGRGAAAKIQPPQQVDKPAVELGAPVPKPQAVAVAVQAPTALAVALEPGAAELTAAEAPRFDPPADLTAQLEVLRRTEAAAEAERDDLLAERDTLSRQLSDQRQRLAAQGAQIASLDAQLHQATQALAAQEHRLAELAPMPAALTQAQAQAVALQAQIRTADQTTQELRAELRAAEQRLHQTQAQLAAEAARREVQEELRLAEAEAAAEQADNSAAVDQLQALQEANSGLQKQLQTLHGATHRARKLALQLREAQAAVAAARSLVGAEGQPGEPLEPLAQEALPIGRVADLVATWAAQPGVHAVAVADLRGLRVAGQGDESLALAARAAALFRALQQSSGWSAGLTLGAADVLQLRDKNGLSLSIKPWQAPGGVLLLAVLAREGVERQAWASELLHRGLSVFVWPSPLTREKKSASPSAPQPSPELQRLASV